MMDYEDKYEKGSTARSHEESRQLICSCCAKKVRTHKSRNPIKKMNVRYEHLLKLYVFSEYSVNNTSYPSALCDSCRLTLVAIEKVKSNFFHTKVNIT